MENKMNLQNKLQLLGLLNEWAQKEAALIWSRYQAMLLASTGLVAILSFALEKKLFWVIYGSSAVGVILAIVWVQIIQLSQFYYQRWQHDADELVKSENEFSKWVRGRINPRVEQPSRFSASMYAIIVPITFFIGWVVVLLSASLGILCEQTH